MSAPTAGRRTKTDTALYGRLTTQTLFGILTSQKTTTYTPLFLPTSLQLLPISLQHFE